jgi:pSer/pThr/pTyr-binding forkhead associated (FHA) protein
MSNRLVDERVLGAGVAIWLGRDPVCDLVLADSSVSRKHLRIEGGSSEVDVIDDSANGTVINGEVVRGARRRVAPPASLQVGPFDIVLRHDEPSRDDARRGHKRREEALPKDAARPAHSAQAVAAQAVVVVGTPSVAIRRSF